MLREVKLEKDELPGVKARPGTLYGEFEHHRCYSFSASDCDLSVPGGSRDASIVRAQAHTLFLGIPSRIWLVLAACVGFFTLNRLISCESNAFSMVPPLWRWKEDQAASVSAQLSSYQT